jgi:hypothetical protein
LEHAAAGHPDGLVTQRSSRASNASSATTPINALAVAPDGTVWAVGEYDGEGGGVYRITPD